MELEVNPAARANPRPVRPAPVRRTDHAESSLTRLLEHQAAKIPSDVFLFSGLGAMVASFALGPFTDFIGRPLRVYQVGMLVTAAAFAPLAFGASRAVLGCLVLFAAASISAIVAYTLLTQLVPPAQTGRVTTASNLALFGTSFFFQWGVGAVLGLWPSAQGSYDAEGYRVAFGVLLAAQAAAAAWLLTAKETRS